MSHHLRQRYVGSEPSMPMQCTMSSVKRSLPQPNRANSVVAGFKEVGASITTILTVVSSNMKRPPTPSQSRSSLMKPKESMVYLHAQFTTDSACATAILEPFGTALWHDRSLSRTQYYRDAKPHSIRYTDSFDAGLVCCTRTGNLNFLFALSLANPTPIIGFAALYRL